MATTLEIVQDGETVLRFERSGTLPGLQRRQLDELDFRMDQGIELGGEAISEPDRQQRTRFVVGLLIRALQRDDSATVRGLSTWLSYRVPELAVIRLRQSGDEMMAELELNGEPGSGE